jgi:hypothetical protein
MTSLQPVFSSSYQEARQKFLQAAHSAHLTVQSHLHPLPGRDGEVLAMDVAREGPADASHLLIVTSACHGVEGYCGSGVQVHALQQESWHRSIRDSGVAVLYIHALNPFGFSHLRRVTHENVDINRNFHDFNQPLPANAAYQELHPLLLPDVWPPDESNTRAVEQFITERGMPAFQSAVSSGQHDFPDGLFFGGRGPTWSNLTLRQVLREHGTQCQRLAWIDLHTGLGPTGVGERIFACANDSAALARAKAWWGEHITSIYDGSSTSAYLTGLMWIAAYEECPQAEYTGIALEYGTRPIEQVLQALRGDHWLHLHPEAPPALRQRIHQDLLDAFYVDTDTWRQQIVDQAMQAMQQAVQGISST